MDKNPKTQVETSDMRIGAWLLLPGFIFLTWTCLFDSDDMLLRLGTGFLSTLLLVGILNSYRQLIFNQDGVHIFLFKRRIKSISYGDIQTFELSVFKGYKASGTTLLCTIHLGTGKRLLFTEKSPKKMIEILNFLLKQANQLNTIEHKKKLHPLYRLENFSLF